MDVAFLAGMTVLDSHFEIDLDPMLLQLRAWDVSVCLDDFRFEKVLPVTYLPSSSILEKP
jgi:hypothetical protein